MVALPDGLELCGLVRPRALVYLRGGQHGWGSGRLDRYTVSHVCMLPRGEVLIVFVSIDFGMREAAHFFMRGDPRIWHPLRGLQGYCFMPGQVPQQIIPVGVADPQSMAPFTPVPRPETSAPPPCVFGNCKS